MYKKWTKGYVPWEKWKEVGITNEEESQETIKKGKTLFRVVTLPDQEPVEENTQKWVR